MMAGCGGKKTGYMDGGMVSPRKAMAMGYMDGGMVGKKKKGYQKGGMVDSMTPQQAMTMGRDLAAKMAGMRNQPMSSGGMRPMMRRDRMV